MNKLKTTITKIIKPKKITSSRISFLGLYLAMMIALKYALGFVPGIELVTFMFIIAGIFFPLADGILLVVSFNLSIIALYGWGAWQIMYWVMWPFDLISAKLISKITKSKYIMASWGFICGFLVAFWYFISDLIFYSQSYAMVNIISALPINLIEGSTTSIVILVCGPSLSLVFDVNYQRLWLQKLPFAFKKTKCKYAWIIILIINLILVTAIITLLIYNQFFLDWKASLLSQERATKI